MRYAILGGTGTLGREITRQLLLEPSSQITILSRCELKQKEMAKDFKFEPRLKFILGDVRDFKSVSQALEGVETVFHVAALKHVDTCELNPEESIKTNILGTINVADAAVSQKVKDVVFSSTDKAVDPINVYGMCKGISEKILLNRNLRPTGTKFHVFRWGNVLGSRGSVIHLFADSLMSEGKIKITDPKMTRFWIRIEDAVSYMLSEYKKGPTQTPRIPPIQASSVLALAQVLADLLQVEDYKIQCVGLRPGEKLHEALRSQHDQEPLESDRASQYTEAQLKDLLKGMMKNGHIASGL